MYETIETGGKATKYDAPRQILKSIEGLEFIEMKRTKENSFAVVEGLEESEQRMQPLKSDPV
ncbi:MAG: hypothetical protein AOA66_1035 [Candidatus Bathyarchaeota archaeon BA2]|nr:MAG: hypothetical protein AOA66_1035 [Candidatus Bathyarchaeota archaeon BA2]